MKPVALATKGLVKRFGGSTAVDGLDIAVERGAITGIVGPNGSGKSTLVNLLSGVVRIDSGCIVIADGLRISRLKPHKALSCGITRTFQDIRLFEQMTVLDNLLVIVTRKSVLGSLLGLHDKKVEAKAREHLRRVGLEDKAEALAVTLSYGQRKLLEAARALCAAEAAAVEVFLFDEPFAGLSPAMTKTLSSILIDLRASGKAVVLIEHNMTLIRELTDKVIVMEGGRFLAEGSADEVLGHGAVIDAYIGA